MSPLGAVRISRGLSRPVAYISTLKPWGAWGHALAGRATTEGPLSTDSWGEGPGKSALVRWRRVPGDSWAASVNADLPVRTVVLPSAAAGPLTAEHDSGRNERADKRTAI